MRIALAQINPTVGDVTGNARLVVDTAIEASREGARLVVFPEMCTTGYPPHDLLHSDHFIDCVVAASHWIHQRIPEGVGVLIGTIVRNPSPSGKRLFNAAMLLERGQEPVVVHKMLLPTYDIYDEYRWFEPAPEQEVIEFDGLRLGVHVCEDMWNDPAYATYHTYRVDPLEELARQGVDLFVNLSASPFSHDRPRLRSEMLAGICRRFGKPFLLANQTGANTEQVFDGGSLVHLPDGSLAVRAKLFQEDLIYWDTGSTDSVPVPTSDRTEELAAALALGIREYFLKSGIFTKALVGLSGGIDSAVTAALAVRALGAERVVGVTMPSAISSGESISDSRNLALNLGIEFHSIPISPVVDAFSDMLSPHFSGTRHGIAEENIQARSRGTTLMALSNKFAYLLLTTGNKSELAMGYATLYGDMVGGLAVLSDVYKTEVYDLAAFLNKEAGREIIPDSTISKAPSAELRPGQKDQDTLPPYPVLDRVLQLYIEERLDVDAIADRTGNDAPFVRGLLEVVDRNEFKRRQAPPGLRVSKKAFGPGRRQPVVQHFDRETASALLQEVHP